MIKRTVVCQRAILVVVVAALATAAGCSSTKSSNSASGKVINVGVIAPFSGKYGAFGGYIGNGVSVAVKEINRNGGVLGGQLAQFSGDSSGDAVDAVPAMRQLLTHGLTYLVGPTSLEFAAVKPIIDGSQLPDFVGLGSAAYDQLQDKWIYDNTPSDSVEALTMTQYAKSKGYTHCALIFDNSESAQTFVPPVIAAFKKNGGTVVANVTLVPGQPSYRTEVLTAFASNPQCVFIQTDNQTSGTLFSNIRELGHLNVPFIGTDAFTDPAEASAIGVPDASRYVYGVSKGNLNGPAYTHFQPLYQALFGKVPTYSAAETYDSTLVGALAMTYANSTNPKVWVNDITKVSNPPGTKCYTYSSCVSLLKSGQKINFEGASGPFDLNKYHHLYSDETIVQFASDGQTLNTVYTASAGSLIAASS